MALNAIFKSWNSGGSKPPGFLTEATTKAKLPDNSGSIVNPSAAGTKPGKPKALMRSAKPDVQAVNPGCQPLTYCGWSRVW